MRALILKDLYVMLHQKNITITLISLFFVASFFFGDPGMLIIFLSVLCITQISMLHAYDETSNWYRFVFTLPVKKADIVKSKYILCIILLFFIAIIIFTVSLITNIMTGNAIGLKETFMILSIVSSGLLVIFGFTIPATIKFGIQKGRILLLATIFIPVIAANVLNNGYIVVRLIDFIDLISLISLPGAAIFFYLSYKLSASILKNKDF